MWILVSLLTLVLWFILDNILVAAMLAIFALFLFTTTRALWLLRKEQKWEKASLKQSANLSNPELMDTQENANELKQADDHVNREHQNQADAQENAYGLKQVTNQTNCEQENILLSDKVGHQVESEEIDDSYLRLVEETSSTTKTASTERVN